MGDFGKWYNKQVSEVSDFQELIWQKGRELYRDMPWRRDVRPYYVLTSELMLQQTQVARVIPKFSEFVATFPDETVLAQASLGDVLQLWHGLGYNRRARFLWLTARQIGGQYGGVFPRGQKELLGLPGVGKNTAGAILAYSYNYPSLFIETNIRTVYIHHFFANEPTVKDSQIIEKLAATIDQNRPRQWYWALMDYGSWLKQQGVRTNSQMEHYKKQSILKGSLREVRGQIVTALLAGELSDTQLRQRVYVDQRYQPALAGLLKDGLVQTYQGFYRLTK